MSQDGSLHYFWSKKSENIFQTKSQMEILGPTSFSFLVVFSRNERFFSVLPIFRAALFYLIWSIFDWFCSFLRLLLDFNSIYKPVKVKIPYISLLKTREFVLFFFFSIIICHLWRYLQGFQHFRNSFRLFRKLQKCLTFGIFSFQSQKSSWVDFQNIFLTTILRKTCVERTAKTSGHRARIIAVFLARRLTCTTI